MELDKSKSVLLLFTLVNYLANLSLCDNDLRITDMLIKADTYNRYSTVSVQSVVQNNNNVSKEMDFTVILPDEAFISYFKMESNSQTLYGVVKEKKEADEAYNRAKEQGQTAGKVVSKGVVPGRNMKVFSIVLNVENGSVATFEMKYEELLKRTLGTYTQTLHIEPQEIVPNLAIEASYSESKYFDIFKYSTPSNISSTTAVFHQDSSSGVALHASDRKRRIRYTPTIDEQMSFDPVLGMKGDFVIQYDIDHANDGGTFIEGGGAFVQYFSPSGLQKMNKNIVFVIDISGSMGGYKIEQTRVAMYNILKRLRHNDFFNIIIFDDTVSWWKSEPHQATTMFIDNAIQYVRDEVKASGSTNINDALKEGISTLVKSVQSKRNRGNIIVFLTDGQPTAGETDVEKIVENVIEENGGRVAVFCLGFGMHVNMDFLTSLASQNGGLAVRIYADQNKEETDAVTQLSDFYESIANITIRNLEFKFPSNLVRADSLTQTQFANYYQGEEIVITGLLASETYSPSVSTDSELAVLLAENGMSLTDFVVVVNGQGQNDVISYQVEIDSTADQHSAPKGYIKRLWAYKKIQDLFGKALITKGDMKDMYQSKALNLSLEYGFVTSLTSMVVTQEVHGQPSLDNDYAQEDRMMMTKVAGSGVRRNNMQIHHMAPGRSSLDKGNVLLTFVLSLFCVFIF